MSRQATHPDVLSFLVREYAARRPVCREAYCGDVVAKAVDQDGCNWRLSHIEGSNCAGCLLEILPFVRHLQACFEVSFEESAARSVDLSQFLRLDS